MGRCPPWYEVIVAARQLDVAPWELLERPDRRMWIELALGAIDAEAHARNPHSH